MSLGTPADLAELRSKLTQQNSTGVKDAKTMISYLKLRRDLGVHDAEGVCEYGTYVLAKAKRQLKTTECA